MEIACAQTGIEEDIEPKRQSEIAIDGALDMLSESQQERLAEIVEYCLAAIEQGDPISLDAILEQEPELEKPLRNCLASLERIHQAVRSHVGKALDFKSIEKSQVIGDFELLSEIGRGGMGVVYKAKQISLDRDVALKVLPIHQWSDPKHIQRFAIEAKAAAQLHHRSIVPVFGVGQERDAHYYAMQLINGQPFDEVPTSTWHQDGLCALLNAFISIADALQYAHDRGVIHRDIKPSNLLYEDNQHVWITDFGLASRAVDPSMTKTGELVGTANYMSPEQALGLPVDERTDIYSLGATLYEIATGSIAHRGTSHREILDFIEYQNPPAPRKLNSNISTDLETVILKAMAKDREHRYASAADFSKDLACVRDHLPISGRRPPLSSRIKRLSARYRMVSGLLLTASLLVACTLFGATCEVWLAHSRLNAALEQSQRSLSHASKSYWQSRQMLDRWNKNLVPELQKIPGTEAISSRILGDTIAFYIAYLERMKDQPLDTDIIEAKLQLAIAYEQSGSVSQATSVYRTMFDSNATRLAKSSSEALRLLAIARNNFGLILIEQRDLQPGIELLNESSRDYIATLAENKDDSEALTGLAIAQLNLANAYQLCGNTNEQLVSIEKALSLLTQIVDERTPALDLRSELATALDHKAALLAVSNPSYAVQLSQYALSLHQACHRESPNDNLIVRQLGASLHNSAVLMSRMQQYGEATVYFSLAIEARTKLVKMIPFATNPRLDLAVTHHAHAMLYCQQEAWRLAIDSFEAAISTVTQGQDMEPETTTPESRTFLAEAMLNRLKVQYDHGFVGDSNDLTGQLERVRSLLDSIEASDRPTNDEWLRLAKFDVQSLTSRSLHSRSGSSNPQGKNPKGPGV